MIKRSCARAFAAFAVLLASAACRSTPTSDADVRAVRAVAEGIVAADNDRDIERVMAFYSDSAVLLPPGSPPKSGLATIRPGYEQLFRDFQPALTSNIDEVVVDGSLAYVRGRTGGSFRSLGAAPSRQVDDVFLMILRRNAGGWKIARLMWHPSRS